MRNLPFETAGGPVRQVSDPIAPGLPLLGVRMRFKRNEEIFGEGESAEHVYRVVSGAARTIRFTSDGRRQVLGFHLSGDVFGIESNARHTMSAEAISDCEIAVTRRSAIEGAAARDFSAAKAVVGLVQQQLQQAQEHVALLGRKGAAERVAAFLLQIGERSAGAREIDLPMSRADIADYLALTIETVSRVFTQMERDEAIDLPASRHVVFRDRCALEALQAA